jgi:hypothetical protein
MAKLFDINTWNEQPWWNTGGTRNKKIYQNPEDGEPYFFKQSYKKGQMDYMHEFWSEIIAYEVGSLCGFDVLPYHIAIRKNTIGCISKSMIVPESEELVEGGKYLQAVDNTFRPEDTDTRNLYSFQLIVQSLYTLELGKYIPKIIEMIVFDALIGNSDRHQENWAIINKHTVFSKSFAEVSDSVEKEEYELFPDFMKKMIKFLYTKKGKIRPELAQARLMMPKETRFAPIYDSGCCFGRELSDERVQLLLNDSQAFNSYIQKGKAEIHWEGKKINHFELLNKISSIKEFQEFVKTPLKSLVEKFDKDKIAKLVFTVDDELLKKGHDKILPQERKDLICNLLFLRFEKLNEIYESLK